MIPPVRLALFGDNGHQLHRGSYLQAGGSELVGYTAFSPEGCEQMSTEFPRVTCYTTLEALLQLPDLDLVVLCSPLRSEQAEHAIQCLQAGLHVLAEKPCAVNEADLDRIMVAAKASGKIFHEMAGTIFEQPWWSMRQIISEGTLGDIQQVLVQKSYPYFDARPCDEKIDGGLIAQNAVHALRFIEQVTGQHITEIQAMDSPIGEERSGSDLRRVSSFMGRLVGGGLFSGVANYCNPFGFGSWGNEMLRIWGTKGMIEAVDGGQCTRLVIGDKDLGPIDCSALPPDFFTGILEEIREGTPMFFDLETELHPTRMVLRASQDARKRRN